MRTAKKISINQIHEWNGMAARLPARGKANRPDRAGCCPVRQRMDIRCIKGLNVFLLFMISSSLSPGRKIVKNYFNSDPNSPSWESPSSSLTWLWG
jgi:hypothetical protein